MRKIPWAIAALCAASAVASVPVREACADDSAIVASVQENDPINVRHAVVGETVPCYSVMVTQAGQEVQGFVLGLTLPAIQEFERTRALESRVAIPPPPAPPSEEKEKKTAALPPVGPSFEPWSGVDVRGKRMQVSGSDAKVTLVTFWSVQSGAARRYVENFKKTETEFRAKGVKSFGMVQAPSAARAGYYLDDMGLESPQAFDRQGLAAKYHADTLKGTTLVVDASNQVVAISSNPAEIRAAVTTLLSSK
jgi:hypothetical protein